jgi:glutathione S-transferase
VIDLYCFGESGNSYKAALTLTLAGLEWRPIYVDFFNGETRTPAFRAINEMGEAPVMIEGGVTYTQSGVMQFRAAELSGRFGGETEAERREVLRWVLWDNHKLSSQAGAARFQMNFLPEDKRPKEVIAFLQARLKSVYKVLDTHLADRDWIAADRLTTADLSCIGYLYFPGEFGLDMAEFPNVDRWRGAIAALPGWKHPYDMMPGHPIPGRS